MDGVIDRLLQIKVFREDKAQLEVNRARHVLNDAEAAVDRANNALDAHRAECQRQESALYAELCTRQVRLWDLQCTMLKVDEFKQSIQDHETRVDDASEERKTSAEGLDNARRRHQEAIRTREKFTELRTLTAEDALIEVARAEDTELEEVALQRPLEAPEDARP